MSDKDDLIVAGVNQKDKGIWRDFYDRYYAALCSYVSKFLSVSDAAALLGFNRIDTHT